MLPWSHVKSGGQRHRLVVLHFHVVHCMARNGWTRSYKFPDTSVNLHRSRSRPAVLTVIRAKSFSALAALQWRDRHLRLSITILLCSGLWFVVLEFTKPTSRIFLRLISIARLLPYIAYALRAKIVFCQILNFCTAQICKNLSFAPYEYCQWCHNLSHYTMT